ncbi:restriction endonuclease subunit S [[Clostridium] dakarense]|uniref:restriction endonuclease subunit S n=1 Tax=Faecalimicrobium dakarense TaxID=1301100 RepID=UPI0004BB1447|nr:restriction endonuclease subunit S [[Clostridium] dakarense]
MKSNNIKILDNDWMEVPFSYMAEHISKRVDPKDTNLDIYIGLEHIDPGSLKIKRYGKPDDVKGTKLIAQPGDIIFGKRRAYQGKVGVCEWDAIVSAHSMVLRPKEENIEKDFLKFFMQSEEFYNRSIQISEGSLSPTIKWKVLEEQRFIIPSKYKQKNIVSKVSKLDNLINQNIDVLEKANIYRKKLIKNLLEDRIVKNEEFKYVKISDVANISRGISWGKEDEFNANENNNRVRVYKIPNIPSNSRYQSDDEKTYITRPNNIEKYFVENNDLLMVSANGNPDRVGNLVKVRKSEEAVFASFLLKIQPKNGINPDFLYYQLVSDIVQKKITEGSRGSTGLKNINVPHMNNIKIKLPNIKEQENIVKLLEEIDCIIENINTKIEYTYKLKLNLFKYYTNNR